MLTNFIFLILTSILTSILCVLLYLIIYKICTLYTLRNQIKSYEKINNTNLILITDIPENYRYYHGYNCIINFILSSYIYNIDSDKLINHLYKLNNNNNNNKNLTLIIDSNGGSIINNDIIINLTSNHFNTTSYILDHAMSAATMIALSSNSIYMSEHSILSPTDPQITIRNETYSIKSLIDLCENKNKDDINDEFLISYYENKKLDIENKENIRKFLNKHYKNKLSEIKKRNVFNKLTSGNISHHTPISYNYLKKHLKINLITSSHIKEIYKLYNYVKITLSE
jgi:hypothetical protein